MPSVLRSAAGTASWTYAGFGLSLISAPLVARALEAEGRGILAACVAPVQVMSWISFLGLPRPLAVSLAKGRAINFGSALWLTGLGIISCALLIFASPILSGGDTRIERGIAIFSVLLILSGLAQLGLEMLHLTSRFMLWNMLRSTSLILPSLISIGLYLTSELDIRTGLAALFIGQLAFVIGGLIAVAPAVRTLTSGLKQQWGFSLRYWFSTVFDSVGARLDQILLAALATSAQLGTYAVAVTCASASGAVTQALNHVAFPAHVSSDGSTGGHARQAVIGTVLSVLSGLVVVAVLHYAGTAIFGDSFQDLAKISAILIVFQVLTDQWQLIVYVNTAKLRSQALFISSLVGLLALTAAVLTVYEWGRLNAVTMSVCMVVFGLFRVTSYAIFARSDHLTTAHRGLNA
ncbi:lipopolysaccharide biosynthesis protein [Rhodococcoides fascians]|uniref:lipopolysaccharide biosynthesis protein n=2 Tax=Nocardiaceae TaxID=85025 RepID=UPI001E38EF54|nr:MULTISPECIES: oligosaccharide flippase family protein [Rhodococcus]